MHKFTHHFDKTIAEAPYDLHSIMLNRAFRLLRKILNYDDITERVAFGMCAICVVTSEVLELVQQRSWGSETAK